MPKYYSICEATASLWRGGGRKNHSLRVYSSASQGYLFHDTENILTFLDIHKSLFILSSLYLDVEVQGNLPLSVVAVRVDPNTIMATFNTRSVPKPAKTSDLEYLNKAKLTGWIQQDIRDPGQEAVAVNYDDIYDECTLLERFTGHCPCPKLEAGTCLPDTLYARFPWLANRQADFAMPETSTYKRVRYKDLNGFAYTPGQYSIADDFTAAIRPWDNYDFNLVEARKAEFNERGQSSARRSAHRKIACSQCIFSTKQYDGKILDCGSITDCEQHAIEEQAWEVLFEWLDESTPYTQGCSAFAVHEILYLMTVAGEDHLSRAVTKTRATLTKLAGFQASAGTLRYKLVPAQGDTRRRVFVYSYEDLRKVIPELPDTKNIPEVTLPRKHVLAHAIYSTWDEVRARDGHQPHAVYSVEHCRGETLITGSSSCSTFNVGCLTPASHVMDYYAALWPRGFPRVAERLHTRPAPRISRE